MNLSPQSPQSKHGNRWSGNSTFSTPERQRRSQEQSEELLRHTPAPKKTSKRKSLMQCYNQAQIQVEKGCQLLSLYDSPNQDNKENEYLEPIQESSNQFEDEFSNNSLGNNMINNPMGQKNFFQKLTDSEYKPSKCYQLLQSENEDSNKENHSNNNLNFAFQQQQQQENPSQYSQQQQHNQFYEPVNFKNYNPQIHKENLNINNKTEYQKIQYNQMTSDTLTEFLLNFNLKSNNILNFFDENISSIEVIGEEKHSLQESLKAFATTISRFQFLQSNIQKQQFEGHLVISVNGSLESSKFNCGEFVMSAKIMKNNDKIIESLKVLFKIDQ